MSSGPAAFALGLLHERAWLDKFGDSVAVPTRCQEISHVNTSLELEVNSSNIKHHLPSYESIFYITLCLQ